MKGGFFDGDRLDAPFRAPLHQDGTPMPWEATLETHLLNRPLTRAGLTSVVPAVTPRVAALVHRVSAVKAEIIDHHTPLPFTLAYETPETLGTDRLAAAAAAWVLFGRHEDETPRPVVALDAGTAVTYEVVDQHGIFRGGTIGAGPRLIRETLARDTAQLPVVALDLPSSPIGRSTHHALQAGIMYAFLDSVSGMLDRISDALGERPYVVATGGWSTLLSTHLDTIDHIEPHLVLHGIRVLMTLYEES